MYTKILFPTDGSDVAQAAALEAVDFARACGSELFVLSVARPTYLMPSDENTMTSDPGFGVEALMKEADRYVDHVARLAQTAGVPCATLTVFSDAPADEIVAVAEREQCDLIVMGSQGRHGLRLLLAGSTTQDVLEVADVPVLVLRPINPARAASPSPANSTA